MVEHSESLSEPSKHSARQLKQARQQSAANPASEVQLQKRELAHHELPRGYEVPRPPRRAAHFPRRTARPLSSSTTHETAQAEEEDAEPRWRRRPPLGVVCCCRRWCCSQDCWSACHSSIDTMCGSKLARLGDSSTSGDTCGRSAPHAPQTRCAASLTKVHCGHVQADCGGGTATACPGAVYTALLPCCAC